MLQRIENLGRSAVRSLDEIGYSAALLGESLRWIFAGRRRRQPVRLAAVLAQMTEMGVLALPISTPAYTGVALRL